MDQFFESQVVEQGKDLARLSEAARVLAETVERRGQKCRENRDRIGDLDLRLSGLETTAQGTEERVDGMARALEKGRNRTAQFLLDVLKLAIAAVIGALATLAGC